ncbi:glycosyltransferase family 9 protein [Roseivirga sp. E12]|uniref:glycosyltransferase family 9 protein n=1 Tax=Roseivirga sp. E12 TaxID=2819237 RepID=UPI001ABC5A62|nr:glycosyltransferase family 9 protein [Roseivirga sp. E12]MBO3699326.1 glycosyltransferase family 9 protein [Roseivirga sp. E12]
MKKSTPKTAPNLESDDLRFSPWKRKESPRRILIIRLQAIGDVALTLGYLQSLRENYPDCQIDFLSRKKINATATSVILFDRVYSLSSSHDARKIAWSILPVLPTLWRQQYDIVIDLQHNRISTLIRRLLRPYSWSEFDRYGRKHAGERYQEAINALGLKSVILRPVQHKNAERGKSTLMENGWDGLNELVLLNPAGYWKTRNWPLENYVEFARIWLRRKNSNARFVCIGDKRIEEKAAYLEQELGSDLVINLVGKTTLIDAYAVLFHIQLMLSEDSGLMHMASTTPMAIFGLIGSTPSYSVHPIGPNRGYLDSSGLACADCHQPECQFGDVRCLTRHKPEFVFEQVIRSMK